MDWRSPALLAEASVGLQAVLLLLAEVIVVRLAVGLGAASRVLLAESMLVRPLVVPVVVRAAVLMGAQRPKDLKKHLSASFSKLQN